MFGRGRSRRAYRVYAEDEFLRAEDPEIETGTLGDSAFDGARPYTAAPRGLPRPLDGRAGLALVALVAMAASALVVHTLRSGIGGGGERMRTSPAPPVAAATSPGASVIVHSGSSAGVTADTPRRSTGFLSSRGGAAPRELREHASRFATRRTPSRRVGVAERFGARLVGVSATAVDAGSVRAPSESSAAAIPEFEFER
jgi:hypothetical protein